jgi:hypothetical protein
MRCPHTLIAICLLILLTAPSVHGADSRFDGHFWRQSDPSTRQFFVYSFMSGIVQGQDRVARRLLASSSGRGFRPECHRAVSHNVNRLEAGLARIEQQRFVEALDLFYAEKANRSVALKWAAQVVIQQLDAQSGAEREPGAGVPPSP